MHHPPHNQIQPPNLPQSPHNPLRKKHRKPHRRPHGPPKPPFRHRQRQQVIEQPEPPPLDALRYDDDVQRPEAVELREVSHGGFGDGAVLPVPELEEVVESRGGEAGGESGDGGFVGETAQAVVGVEEGEVAEGAVGLVGGVHGVEAFSAYGVGAGEGEGFGVCGPADEAGWGILWDIGGVGGDVVCGAVCVLRGSRFEEGGEAGQVQVVERAAW